MKAADDQYCGLRIEVNNILRRHQAEVRTCLEQWLCVSHVTEEAEQPSTPVSPLRAAAGNDLIFSVPSPTFDEPGEVAHATTGGASVDAPSVQAWNLQGSRSPTLGEASEGVQTRSRRLCPSPLGQLAVSASSMSLLGKRQTPVHQRVEITSPVLRQMRFRRPLTPVLKTRGLLGTVDENALQNLTKSAVYDIVRLVSIFANALFVLGETERRASIAADDPFSAAAVRGEVFYNVVTDVFCVLFLFDLVLRMVADGKRFYWTHHWLWNAFDVACVSTAVAESIARWHQYATSELTDFRAFAGKFAALRIVRVLWVVRSTRAIRLHHLTREFAIMVYSLTGAVKPLVWSVALVCVVLFVFSAFFTDGAVTVLVQSTADASVPPPADLLRFFERLPRGALSLYMAMSGGVDWFEIWDALGTMSFDYRLVFIFFLTFAILALMNVITAVFVQAAMTSTQRDSELLIQQEVERKTEFVANLQRLFDELDTNGSGTLSLDEFEKQMEDENALTFMSTLDLDVDNVRTLLTLLDRDQNEQVDIQEFIQGCLRLKGGAKNLDMAILQYQIEWILHNVARLSTVFQATVGEDASSTLPSN